MYSPVSAFVVYSCVVSDVQFGTLGSTVTLTCRGSHQGYVPIYHTVQPLRDTAEPSLPVNTDNFMLHN